MALTQTQLADAVAEQAGITRNEAKNVLTALEEVILSEIGNAQKVKIGNLVQLTVRLKPATKARQGRNPATGEEITISAKPASVDVRARALAKAKAALPSLAKASIRSSVSCFGVWSVMSTTTSRSVSADSPLIAEAGFVPAESTVSCFARSATVAHVQSLPSYLSPTLWGG